MRESITLGSEKSCGIITFCNKLHLYIINNEGIVNFSLSIILTWRTMRALFYFHRPLQWRRDEKFLPLLPLPPSRCHYLCKICVHGVIKYYYACVSYLANWICQQFTTHASGDIFTLCCACLEGYSRDSTIIS